MSCTLINEIKINNSHDHKDGLYVHNLCCDVHCTQWAMWQNHKYIHIQAEHRTGMLVMLRTMEAHDSSIEITHLLIDCVHYLLYNMYSSRHRMSVCVGFVQNWMFVFIFILKQKWNSSRFYNDDASTNERETHTTKFYAKEKCHIWKPVCFCSNSLSVGRYLDWREREKKNNNTKALLNLWLAISEWVGERLKIQEENPDEIMNMHDSHISNQLEMKWSYVWNTNTNTSAQNTVIQQNNTLL